MQEGTAAQTPALPRPPANGDVSTANPSQTGASFRLHRPRPRPRAGGVGSHCPQHVSAPT